MLKFKGTNFLLLLLIMSGCEVTPKKVSNEKVVGDIYETIRKQVDKKEPEFRPEVKILYHFWESPSSKFEYIRINGMLCLRWIKTTPNDYSGITCNWNQFSPANLPLEEK